MPTDALERKYLCSAPHLLLTDGARGDYDGAPEGNLMLSTSIGRAPGWANGNGCR
jgi:hypothetical protein